MVHCIFPIYDFINIVIEKKKKGREKLLHMNEALLILCIFDWEKVRV